ncbi:MAG: phosphopyruvate hydratase [Planctomycetes bacterium]|nr:phosphopyruvate hydratase [Planctomycetota bacterium]
MAVEHPEIISRLQAREVLDSRGQPTVEVEVACRGGARGRAIVPAGASTGRHEAVELRDGDPARYGGKGVRRAVQAVREQIAPYILGLAVTEQALVDQTLRTLDGTPNKSRLGANALLGVSLACAHAAAAVRQLPLWRSLSTGVPPRLPLPMVNLISGGLHAGGNLDFQDFLLLPLGARSVAEALEMTVAVYRSLSATLVRHGYEGRLVGDEGGFGPRLQSNGQAIHLIIEAMERAGYAPGREAALAIDVAASHFYREGGYHLGATTQTDLSSEELAGLLQRWADAYPILSIEDGMAEDDWDGWRQLTSALGQRVQLIGDDLFATNPQRLQRGLAAGVANSVLIKPNQIGTLTETLEVLALARAAGYRPVLSARSGETEDTTIADLAVATGAGQIKIGSVARSERLAKYNQLLRIEDEGGADLPFAGWQELEG